jgi:ATP-dependent Clp protease ATP-binding subunit ClpC
LLPASEHAQEALRFADEEARALHHSYIGTEHILLGLLREPDAVAAGALASLEITRERVLAAILGMMGTGVEDAAVELPFTGTANEAVQRAAREASLLGADHIGTEHILVALMRDPGGAAARILLGLDVDPAAIRAAVSGRSR